MEEMPAEYGNRLIGRAEAARQILAYTGRAYTDEDFTRRPSEFVKGVIYASEAVALWAHMYFGIEPEPGKCPCYSCKKTHGSVER